MKPINLLLLLLLLLLFFSGKIQAGSTEMIQKLLPTGKESNISLTEDVCPENSTVLWFDHLNRTMGTYYPDGETKVEPLFEGKVNITGPRTLTFLSPQTSDSRVYFAKVIGDQHKNTKISFNVTFQGSTEMIQKFLPTGERASINFPADDPPKSCVFYKSNITIGICYYDEEPKLRENFTGKVELSCPASLIFPSPQTSDCGVYSAQLMGDRIQTMKYNVTFQDPVSPVELKLHVNPDSSCKATCSTEGDEIVGTLSCDNKSCHLAGGERSKVTKSGASLRLYQSNESIICNHSNQINWTQSKEEIQLCLRSEGSTDQTTLPAIVGIIVAAIIGVLLYCYIEKKLCFAQRQTGSSNSQTLPQLPQANGDTHDIPESDRLMNENIAESPV